jgi:hypothetical protein
LNVGNTHFKDFENYFSRLPFPRNLENLKRESVRAEVAIRPAVLPCELQNSFEQFGRAINVVPTASLVIAKPLDDRLPLSFDLGGTTRRCSLRSDVRSESLVALPTLSICAPIVRPVRLFVLFHRTTSMK